ncbi:hypothetical protein OAJ27_00045 [bacterium]|nr:hypothetical protein [bacterium]
MSIQDKGCIPTGIVRRMSKRFESGEESVHNRILRDGLSKPAESCLELPAMGDVTAAEKAAREAAREAARKAVEKAAREAVERSIREAAREAPVSAPVLAPAPAPDSSTTEESTMADIGRMVLKERLLEEQMEQEASNFINESLPATEKTSEVGQMKYLEQNIEFMSVLNKEILEKPYSADNLGRLKNLKDVKKVLQDKGHSLFTNEEVLIILKNVLNHLENKKRMKELDDVIGRKVDSLTKSRFFNKKSKQIQVIEYVLTKMNCIEGVGFGQEEFSKKSMLELRLRIPAVEKEFEKHIDKTTFLNEDVMNVLEKALKSLKESSWANRAKVSAEVLLALL